MPCASPHASPCFLHSRHSGLFSDRKQAEQKGNTPDRCQARTPSALLMARPTPVCLCVFCPPVLPPPIPSLLPKLPPPSHSHSVIGRPCARLQAARHEWARPPRDYSLVPEGRPLHTHSKEPNTLRQDRARGCWACPGRQHPSAVWFLRGGLPWICICPCGDMQVCAQVCAHVCRGA